LSQSYIELRVSGDSAESGKAEPRGGIWRVKENAWCSFAIWNRTSMLRLWAGCCNSTVFAWHRQATITIVPRKR